MTKKTTKSKHDINNTCNSARDTERTLPDQQQSIGLSNHDTQTWNSTHTWSRVSDGCGIPPYYTRERIAELEQNSAMLGQIAGVVLDFCEGEETTLQGVIRAVAMLRESQANELWNHWEKENNCE